MIQRMLFVIIVVITRSFGTVLFDIVIFLQLKTEKENFFFFKHCCNIAGRPLCEN